MKAKRAKLTPAQRKAKAEEQGGLCGCGCGDPLEGKGDVGEHVWEFVSLGNDGKPDKLYRKQCARRKTNGPRGDLNTISHIKQLAEGRTQHDRRVKRGYSLIRSRNTLAKGNMKKRLGDGKVVPRDDGR